MSDDDKNKNQTAKRPPGVPAPPSQAEIEQISRDQALIADEWSDNPPPQRDKAD